MLVIVRILGTLNLRQWMLFQLLHHHFDRLVELRVVSLAVSGRVQIDLVIWGIPWFSTSHSPLSPYSAARGAVTRPPSISSG